MTGTKTPSKDHYAALGVSRHASAAEIRGAYRRAAKKWHPDRLPPHATAAQRLEATAKAAAINEAGSVLGDATRRKEYDASRPRLESRLPAPPKRRLRVAPSQIRLAQITPGQEVVTRLSIWVEDGGRIFGCPAVATPPGCIATASTHAMGERRADIDVRIDTRLLAGEAAYRFNTVLSCGDASTEVEIAIATGPLPAYWDAGTRTVNESVSATRGTWPLSRLARRWQLLGWLVGTVLAPVAAIAWARGHVHHALERLAPSLDLTREELADYQRITTALEPPNYGPWIVLASAAVLVSGLWAVTPSRGFKQTDRLGPILTISAGLPSAAGVILGVAVGVMIGLAAVVLAVVVVLAVIFALLSLVILFGILFIALGDG